MQTPEEIQKKMTKEMTELFAIFQEDFKLYFEFRETFYKLDESAYIEAYNMMDECESLLERFNTIYTLGAKEVAGYGTKTEVASFYKGYYKSLERMYERLRMMWNRGRKIMEG